VLSISLRPVSTMRLPKGKKISGGENVYYILGKKEGRLTSAVLLKDTPFVRRLREGGTSEHVKDTWTVSLHGGEKGGRHDSDGGKKSSKVLFLQSKKRTNLRI